MQFIYYVTFFYLRENWNTILGLWFGAPSSDKCQYIFFFAIHYQLFVYNFQEELVLKNNEDGTWTMGKKERTSTFKLNEDWDENWGQVTAKNNVQGKITLFRNKRFMLNEIV